MPTVATLTVNPAVDKSTSVGHVVPERKLRCRSPRYEPGGGGLNVSRAIRNLGGESVAVFTAGGPHGDLLRALLSEERGMSCRVVPIGEMTRESLTVLEETTGLQYRFGMPGPVLQEDEWCRCLRELSALSPQPDYVVASGSLPSGVPDDFYAQVARVGRQLGARVIVDTSGEALRSALRAGVFLLKPNLTELSTLAGREAVMEDEQERVMAGIVASGQSEAVVLSLGAAGALLATKSGIERLRSPTVPVKSKIGAGDSMVAGIVLGLARGWSLRDAVRFGVAAGAAAVMTPGTELCRREDAERLYPQVTSYPA